MPGSPLDHLDRIAPRAAADCGQLLAAAAVQHAGERDPAVFALAGRLRRRTDALAQACAAEGSADARSAALELRFRSATDLLVAAAQRARRALGASDPRVPANRHAVRLLDQGLERWLDPYAAEAAGTAELVSWAQDLRTLPPGLMPALEPVLAAMDAARAAGAAWDAADAARAAAISERARTQRAWGDAVQSLAAAAGDGPWLVPLDHARRQTPAQDTWFEEEE